MDPRELTDFVSFVSLLGAWPSEAESRFTDFNEDCLRHALEVRLAALGLETPAQWVLAAQRDPAEITNLHRACFNSTSAFFRHPWSYCLLEQHILPDLSSRGPVRVWSAGCAGGQEAYSLAILLGELELLHTSAERSTIIASDADPETLDRAATGGYPQSQLQGLSLGRLRRWFEPHPDGFAPIPELRARVLFSRHDLLDTQAFSPPEAVFGGFDLICCANVLLYYTLHAQVRILENLRRALSNGGVLMVGPTEAGIVNRSHLFAPCVEGPLFRGATGVT